VAPYSAFKWTKDPKTLKTFIAIAGGAPRGFCGDCGSWIYFRSEGADRITVTYGSIDPLYLWGEGADGVEVPKGGFGKALASGLGGHWYTDNAIPEVTDNIPLLNKGGDRFRGDNDEEE
jgi:hypothetical protein